jgi:hypothetical protein
MTNKIRIVQKDTVGYVADDRDINQQCKALYLMLLCRHFVTNGIIYIDT